MLIKIIFSTQSALFANHSPNLFIENKLYVVKIHVVYDSVMIYCWTLLNCLCSSPVHRLEEFCFSSWITCCVWSFALFSLPKKLFCVNNIERVYILIHWLGLEGFLRTICSEVFTFCNMRIAFMNRNNGPLIYMYY